MTGRKPPRAGWFDGRLVLGLLNAALGRPAGFAAFGDTRDSVLGTLAPVLGVLIVLSASLAWSGHWRIAVAMFLVAVCNVLAPPVIAELVCRAWGRRAQWARFASVLNCTPWLVLGLLLLLMPVAEVAVSLGAAPLAAAGAMIGGVMVYSVWFNWFAARHILDLSPVRALGAVLVIVVGTALLLQIPVVASEMLGIMPAVPAFSAVGDAQDTGPK